MGAASTTFAAHDGSNNAGEPYIGVNAGAFTYDNSRDYEDDLVGTYGIDFGYQFTPHFAVELGTNLIQDTDVHAGNREVEGDLYQLDAIYYFDPNGNWKPYALIGGGHLRVDGNGSTTDSESIVSVGIGVQKELTDNVEFRAELRALNSVEYADIDWMGTVGLYYYFGEDHRTAPAEPQPIVVVTDRVAEGDDDGDGVLNSKDKCPNTPQGALVDQYGCQIILKEKVSIRLNVEFDTNKDNVKEQYFEEIKKVADFMRKYPSTNTSIEGHADHRGSDEFNQDLSQRRADSVRMTLIDQFAVDANRLTSVGYGESRPIADNNTVEGMQQNRRVVAVIKASEDKPQQK